MSLKGKNRSTAIISVASILIGVGRHRVAILGKENMTFKQFLVEQFLEQTDGLVHDDLPDVYERWVGEQSVDTIISLAQEWHEKKNTKVLEKRS